MRIYLYQTSYILKTNVDVCFDGIVIDTYDEQNFDDEDAVDNKPTWSITLPRECVIGA